MAEPRNSKTTNPGPDWVNWVHDAGGVASDLPDLLVDATRIAHTVTHGLHGRRRAGTGETFWQFRRFQSGDPASKIDWRRSAKDDHIYIREQEWEAAHTIWLWPDRSPGMRWNSVQANVTKEHRAIILALALTNLLVRSGERVGIPELTNPSLSKTTPRRIAESIARMGDTTRDATLPPSGAIRSYSDYVIFSDFLGDADLLEPCLQSIAAEGVRCHLVQVLDPAEESFPFEGHMEFVAPDGKTRLRSGRAESLQSEYLSRLQLLRARLQSLARRIDGTFLTHRTDQPPHSVLLALHGNLTAEYHASAFAAPTRFQITGAGP